ncbi:MAG: tetratricopeptide repeat protein [Oligoflexia bacterium]|nr:tetratricopeptide repeat protein [Oligoflexia bacterium]
MRTLSRKLSRDHVSSGWFRSVLFATAALGLCSSVAALAAESAAEAVKIETFRTHSRIVVRIDESVPTEWKNRPDGFDLTLKGVGLMELGIPLGDEPAWKARIESLSDSRIGSLKVTEAGGNLRIQGKWKFPTGPQAPVTPRMEAFDYRDKNPPQLVVDLWPKKGPTVAELKASRRASEQLEQMKRAESEARARAERRLASLQRKAETEDLGRFCRQDLSEKTDIFLPFLPFHEPLNYSRWLATTTPDSHFVYFVPKGKERDAQYVRLALDLYRQGKPALVSRTLDFHEDEHPSSPYRQEMRFLKANALIKVGMEAQAEEILARLMGDAKDSPVALHSCMYLAARRAMKGGGLGALEPFLWLINNYPQNRLAWLFHLGAAETYYGLRQVERASKEYQWVMEFAPERRYKAEAAARLGDLYLGKLQHEQALAAYSEGLRYFGKELEEFPSLHVNRGEVLYQLGQLDRAKGAFEEFLAKFPAHPAGWRATFRLGEIAGRSGDPKAREWFYQTINRFPFSSGATLARLRLVTCGDHGGFTADSGEKFFDTEAKSFDGKGEVVMGRYGELKGLARVRALIAWGQDERAVEAAVAELEASRDSAIRPALNSMLSVLCRRRIQGLLAEGKKYEAIAFYQAKSRYLPQEARTVEPDYLLNLARAASDLGMGKVASDLLATHEKIADRAPAADDPDARLRHAELRFTEAKALWTSRGASSAPQDVDARIASLLSQVIEESPFSFEREVMLGLLAEGKGRDAEARLHALRAQLLRPQADASGPRVQAWIASLEARAGEPKAALELLRKLETVAGQTDDGASTAAVLGLPPVPGRETLALAQAELLEGQGRWGEAAAAYARTLDGGKGGNQAKYGFARALLRSGGVKERARGIELLRQLAQVGAPGAGEARKPASSAATEAGKQDFWKKLAMETLANEESKTAKEGKQ